MNCPACGNELTPQNVNGIILNACAHGCGGIWFDWPELNKFDAPQDPGSELLTLETGECPMLNQSRRYSCPHCDDIVMARHFISIPEDVLIDECPSCGGFWLNGDELDDLRQNPEGVLCDSGPAKFSEPGQATQDAQTQRMDRLANAIRFLCLNQCVG